MPFAKPSFGRGYPIFILNRSPVHETDEEFMKGLIETMKTIRKNNPNTLVIYRSSSIGHPFCDDAEGPIEGLTDSDYKVLPFGWSETKRRNLIAKTIIEGAGGVYVDLGALTDLRPDGHYSWLWMERFHLKNKINAHDNHVNWDALRNFLPTSFGKQEEKKDFTQEFEKTKREPNGKKDEQKDNKPLEKQSDDEDEEDDEVEDAGYSFSESPPISHEIKLNDHFRAVSALTLDPAGARLITGGYDYDVKFWDFAGMDNHSNLLEPFNLAKTIKFTSFSTLFLETHFL
ncbi:unnamed protein product [Rhizopus microsporus]